MTISGSSVIRRRSLGRHTALSFSPNSDPPIASLMIPSVVWVRPEMSLEGARALLLDNDISAAPVLDDAGRPLGLVTTSDLLRAAQTIPPLTVGDLKLEAPLCLPQDTPAAQAAALMVLEDVHRVIVVDRDGYLAGVLTSLDLISEAVSLERAKQGSYIQRLA